MDLLGEMQEIITKKTVFELHKPKDFVKDYIVSHKTISKDSSTDRTY